MRTREAYRQFESAQSMRGKSEGKAAGLEAGQRALISALAAGAAMELGRDPPPLAWVGWRIDLNPERGTQPLNRWETYERKATLEWSL
jgi:hypothetical protein